VYRLHQHGVQSDCHEQQPQAVPARERARRLAIAVDENHPADDERCNRRAEQRLAHPGTTAAVDKEGGRQTVNGDQDDKNHGREHGAESGEQPPATLLKSARLSAQQCASQMTGC